MQPQEIRASISNVIDHFRAHPEQALSEDSPARAVLQGGLRIRVEGPGSWVITTDMPAPLGGDGSAPSPGWLRRAAQAACEATMIAIAAAQAGVELKALEVEAGSRSDDRGMLNMGAEAPAGPIEAWSRVALSADGVSPERLRELVESAERHSPVTDSLCRAVSHRLHVEIT